MKKVYIYAFLQKNLGDDLFVKILCERYPNIRFYAMCDSNMMDSLKEIKNLKLIPRIKILDKFSNLFNVTINLNNRVQKKISQSCDLIVNIGGSLFIENSKWEKKHSNFKYRIVKDKPVFLIGSNFGPYNNESFFYEYTKTFSQFTDVCFREELSYKLFENNLNNLRYNSDVVFSYDHTFKTSNPKEKYIVISVINLSTRKDLMIYEDLYIKFLLECYKFFIKKGYKVYFMSFCSIEGDEIFIKKLKGKFNFEFDYYFYDNNIEEALSFLSNSSGIIASRFHAMILGWVFSVPVIPVIYSNKSLNVINDVGFTGKYVDIKSLKDIDLSSVFNDFFKEKVIDLEKNKKSALNQFYKLDKFLM